MKSFLWPVTVTVIALFSMGYVAFQHGYVRFNYPDKEKYPVRGIDISHHNGTIDWRKLTNENIDFVFIKATEGADFVDPAFTSNWKLAKKSGILAGAYHFFTLCTPGSAQARHFIKQVAVEPRALPPAIDIEFGGNCSHLPSKKSLLKELDDYIEAVEAKFKRSPVIYLTYEMYERYLAGELKSIPIWIRDIYRHPRLKPDRNWRFWQYSNRGRLDGIPTPVDLNLFNGNKREFLSFVSAGKP